MDVDYAAKKRRQSRNVTDGGRGVNTTDLYRFAVQFYKVPPVDVISLEEFEQFALDRLTVLRIVENANFKHLKAADRQAYIGSEIRKKKELWPFLTKSAQISDTTTKELVYEQRRKDHFSHFILRLAYCRSDELRKWFLKHEVDLFQMRFTGEEKFIQDILKHNGLHYDAIDDSEKESLLDDLQSAMYRPNEKATTAMKFYKVPFLEILDLVGQRKVFLKGGFAYVPQNDLGSVVANVFRMQLSQSLALMARLLPQMEEEDRLLSILKGLNDRYLGQDFGKNSKAGSGEVVPEMIDKLSRTSFPMCMRAIHDSMRDKHHLKHHGRLVYGLFLKAIGLSLEDAQRFFREEFLKSMDSETYEKKGYTYNIRYNYGEEGKKTNFTPYSCSAVITKHAPGPGEVHGCPYKHFDRNILTHRLQAMNIPKAAVNEIVELASNGHYQVACTKQFEVTHGGVSLSQAVNHPNYYYEESRKTLSNAGGSEVKISDKVKPVTKRSVILPSQSCSDEMELTQEDLDMLSQYSSTNE